MKARAIRPENRGGAVVGAVLALALFMRLIMPSGWMPVAGDGYAITLCTGSGVASAWVDADGVIHRDGKGTAQKADHPCIFAGLSADLLAAGPLGALDQVAAFAVLVAALPLQAVSIGRGLAAPPPPPTGPPASL